MDISLPVSTWTRWTDYAQATSRSPIVTFDDKWYTAIIISIGVLFGLALPAIQRLLAHIIAAIGFEISKRWLTPAAIPDHFLDKGPKYLSAFAVVVGIAYTIATTFATNLAAGEAALSSSKICGAFGLRDDANTAAQDADALLQGEKESKAGQQPYIKTAHVDQEQRCPFVNETYCAGNGFSAVRFSTGSVDAKDIGINAGHTLSFNRTSICVPLDINAGFAKDLGGGSEIGKWGYELGSVGSEQYSPSEYTFQQYGDPFSFDVRSYTMSTYVHTYSKSRIQNYWQPIEALNVREDLKSKADRYSIMIMFVKSCRIFYKKSSEDPIFPARRLYPGSDLWFNDDSRARPLVCIDWVEICKRKGQCVPTYDETLDGDSDAFVFTRMALNKSSAYYAMVSRGAMGLDAQYRIKDDTSLPLTSQHPQWVEESRNIFQSSLSRVQFDAMDIARGARYDGNKLYTPKTPPKFDGQMCNLFTFRLPKGYHNMAIIPLTLLQFLVPAVLTGFGLQTKVMFSEERQQSPWFKDTNLLFVERIPGMIVRLLQRTPSAGVLAQDEDDAWNETPPTAD
ncbi:unnamed protein product [Zymoseptoria tritici ST99CH_1E4]|uniref:Uncharacterized protein n=1 Tax=Zymoseptoria tritici ST99CH_1E4 TaxID=1276532 RepID=A0A2H1H7N0_ZYMTR|nr:unnamed protein product [Zymoseptoria tritici ST99CH_1E4]